MTGAEAEARYFELYRLFMRDRDHSKPLVQEEIRSKAWDRLVAEIETRALLPIITEDANSPRLRFHVKP
jgi:hypothetical protein